MSTRILAVALLSALALGACSSNSKKSESTKPAKLVDFRPAFRVERVWHASVGGQKPKLRVGLAKRLIAAGRKDAARDELQAVQQLGNRYAGQAEVGELLAKL